jgi:hypothetical protein
VGNAEKQKIIMGKWDMGGGFVPHVSQPDEPISQMADMLKWAHDIVDGKVGEYEFIRVVPGALVVAQQLHFDFVNKTESKGSRNENSKLSS